MLVGMSSLAMNSRGRGRPGPGHVSTGRHRIRRAGVAGAVIILWGSAAAPDQTAHAASLHKRSHLMAHFGCQLCFQATRGQFARLILFDVT